MKESGDDGKGTLESQFTFDNLLSEYENMQFYDDN